MSKVGDGEELMRTDERNTSLQDEQEGGKNMKQKAGRVAGESSLSHLIQR